MGGGRKIRWGDVGRCVVGNVWGGDVGGEVW